MLRIGKDKKALKFVKKRVILCLYMFFEHQTNHMKVLLKS